MSIPDFQSIMLPMLEVASDGQVRSSAEYRAVRADRFQLSAPTVQVNMSGRSFLKRGTGE